MKKSYLILGIVLAASIILSIVIYRLSVNMEATKNMQAAQSSVQIPLQDNQKQEIQKENKPPEKPNLSSDLPEVAQKQIPKEELQQEQFDKVQLKFTNIDKLYDDFTPIQVEQIKQKVQSYIHQYIDKDILSCSLAEGSIKKKDNIITFELNLPNVKRFQVKVTKDMNNNITNTTMLQSL